MERPSAALGESQFAAKRPFGGEDCFGGEGVFTEGQYKPATDSWRPTPVRDARPALSHQRRLDRKRDDRLGWTSDRLEYLYLDGTPLPASTAVSHFSK